MVIRLLSNIKQLVIVPGEAPRTIKSGPFRGIMMELDLSHQTQLYLGLFERELYKWLKLLSSGINSAIDIGACDGEYTLYFLTKTPAKKVFAFEPSAGNRVRLLANLKLNRLTDSPRLQLSWNFVSSSDGDNQCTLNSLLPSISEPCLIKMDVDGPEANILRGANKLLELHQIRWIIETHSQELEKECMQILDRAGFLTKIVPNAWWRLFIPELRVSPQNRWLIATRDSVAQI